MSSLATSALRLVDTVEADRGPLRFERRRAPRHQARARCLASCLGPDVPAGEDRQMRLAPVELVDQSFSGLGAWSRYPMPVGGQIELTHVVAEKEAGRIFRGEVVRCLPAGEGFRIGIRLEAQARGAA